MLQQVLVIMIGTNPALASSTGLPDERPAANEAATDAPGDGSAVEGAEECPDEPERDCDVYCNSINAAEKCCCHQGDKCVRDWSTCRCEPA
jgi:hypothetical protein